MAESGQKDITTILTVDAVLNVGYFLSWTPFSCHYKTKRLKVIRCSWNYILTSLELCGFYEYKTHIQYMKKIYEYEYKNKEYKEYKNKK